MKTTSILLALLFSVLQLPAQDQPLKLAVIGLNHGHSNWVFDAEKRGDIIITGFVEPDRAMAKQLCDHHGFDLERVYSSVAELLDKTEVPEAVAAFGTIYDHLEVVETFAPLKVHVMVEKPLAVSSKHARKMATLAQENGIQLLTNYETTWYPTNHKAKDLVEEGRIGAIRKVIVRDGHRGPKKIGVGKEFLSWLTDPVQNGGGAVTDFGCYGANLITWLMEGKRPKSVTALLTQLQPENNPLVDDEAIILLEFEDAVGVIQASWNWPMGRKDMEVYGLTGAVYADNRHNLRVRKAEGYDGYEEERMELPERSPLYSDPFRYLRGIIRGEITPRPYNLSSLENNMLVVEILEAAKKSAKKGRSIKLK